jgi:hypothetical protein
MTLDINNYKSYRNADCIAVFSSCTRMDRRPSESLPVDGMTTDLQTVPDGYALVVGPNGEHHIVPEYLIPATHQAFAGYRKRMELDVRNEQGGVSVHLRITSLATPAFDWPTPMPAYQMPMPICQCRCRCLPFPGVVSETLH